MALRRGNYAIKTTVPIGRLRSLLNPLDSCTTTAIRRRHRWKGAFASASRRTTPRRPSLTGTTSACPPGVFGRLSYSRSHARRSTCVYASTSWRRTSSQRTNSRFAPALRLCQPAQNVCGGDTISHQSGVRDPFQWRFNSHYCWRSIAVAVLFRMKRDGKDVAPWTGSAVARFESSTSPEHAGRRVVCLRIVKIVTPFSCTVEQYKGRIVKPEEGQLLTMCVRGRAPAPWSYDIDAKNSAPASALRVLWDNSRPRTM
ncbi:hypothetical protein B0H12DRAFT_57328 [Mycena haematopus]|nr:hypothetical protein B0H12DRAFT_57328 [Mycena haematopus]